MPHRKNILVVEDQLDQWYLTKKGIEQNIPNAQAIHTGSVIATLEYLAFLDRRQLPALILLDLYLPRLEDGLQILRTIKEDTTLNFVPVVVYSHSANQDNVAACYHLGCSSYIVKPLSAADWNHYFATINTYWWLTVTIPGR